MILPRSERVALCHVRGMPRLEALGRARAEKRGRPLAVRPSDGRHPLDDEGIRGHM